MTRAMRDRLAVGGRPRKAHTFATVRIRLPEGLLLQVSMWQAVPFCLGRHVWRCAGKVPGMLLLARLLLRAGRPLCEQWQPAGGARAAGECGGQAGTAKGCAGHAPLPPFAAGAPAAGCVRQTGTCARLFHGVARL